MVFVLPWSIEFFSRLAAPLLPGGTRQVKSMKIAGIQIFHSTSQTQALPVLKDGPIPEFFADDIVIFKQCANSLVGYEPTFILISNFIIPDRTAFSMVSRDDYLVLRCFAIVREPVEVDDWNRSPFDGPCRHSQAKKDIVIHSFPA
jgi:hypothetical protein